MSRDHVEEKQCKSNISNKYIWVRENSKNHSFLLPKDIRLIISGKSGYGKTILLTYLLLEPDILDYNTLVVCSRSLHQQIYQILKEAFAKNLSKGQVRLMFENQDLISKEYDEPLNFIRSYEGACKGEVNANFYENISEILDPSAYDGTQKNLLILDDVMIGPQSKAEAFFTRGRHNSVDVIYITQNYFRLPRQTIRENANIFIFFKQDQKNLTHIYQDHCSIDGIPFEIFRDFCKDVWAQNKHNFVTIDTSRPSICGKYRRNLNDYWVPPITSIQ